MQRLDLTSTIVAVSSGIAPGRRAIVRLSGSESGRILTHLLDHAALAEVTQASRPLRIETRATVSMEGRRLALPVACHWWPDSRCFTGEPSAELHLIGSLPLVELLVEQILRHGARPAERGEFTLRSFLAGKIDLTQAEAVLGVIEADESRELELALGQLGGNISEPVRHLRSQLLELTSHLEAGLDFVEEDIEFISSEALVTQLEEIRHSLSDLAHRLVSRGARTRQPSVVLIGLPNAGKSTLFNLLLGEPRAIVSPQAGTTRDAVSAAIQLGNLQAELVDTAGMEELSENSPRVLAQSVLRARLEVADLAIVCVAADQTVDEDWLSIQLGSLPPGLPKLVVATKSRQQPDAWPQADVAVDQADLSSMNALRKAIADKLAGSQAEFHSSAMHLTLMRCRDGMLQAEESLQRAIEHALHETGEELIAAELRLALDALSAIIGDVHTEDILGEIFSRFCIGK